MREVTKFPRKMGSAVENTFNLNEIVDPSTIMTADEIRREKIGLKQFFLGCASTMQALKWCAR